MQALASMKIVKPGGHTTKHLQISQYGYLWFILSVLGIDVYIRPIPKETFNRILHSTKKYTFSLTQLCTVIYLMFETFRAEHWNYATFLNASLAIMPIMLWFSMVTKAKQIRRFFLLLKETSTNLPNSKMAGRVNQFLITGIFFPCLIFLVDLFKNKLGLTQAIKTEPIYDNLLLILWIFHEQTISFIMTVLYCVTCKLFLHQLRIYQKKFTRLLKGNPPANVLFSLLEDYLRTFKCIECFQETFSTYVFYVMWQNIVYMAFVALIVVSKKDIDIPFGLGLQMVLFLTYSFCIIGVVTVLAAAIPTEMRRVKAILLDPSISCMRMLQKQTDCKDRWKVILKRDIIAMTACGVFVLDRTFPMKCVAAIVAHSVIIYQIAG